VIGRIVGLWRYPVKSMAAEPLDAVEVSWRGLTGDRRWAFVRERVRHSGLSWLTLRECPDLTRYHPMFVEPGQPDASPVVVETPSGARLDVTDPALAAELGHDAQAVKQDRGTFDTMPLSILSTRTVAGLGELVGRDLDPRRFRPNLLIETAGGAAFPEDGWVGSTLHVGNATIRVDVRDTRCAVVNIDPTTAVRDPAVLRGIARERDTCLGVYGSTVRPGRVAIGDAIHLAS
jgi:uncharacterized protein